MPTLRFHGGSFAMSRSPIRMRPRGVGPNPAIARSSVDLPEPEGPRKAKNSPGSMTMSMPSSTLVSPNDRCRSSMRMPALVCVISSVS